MDGLNLDPFLRLLRADLGAWISLGAIGLILALMAWTSWGSRRALRKCLVLSIAVHLGLVVYGGAVPLGLRAPDRFDEQAKPRIRNIRVLPRIERPGGSGTGAGRSGRRLADWDRPVSGAEVALASPTLRPDRPVPRAIEAERRAEPLANPETEAPEVPGSDLKPPEPRSVPEPPPSEPPKPGAVAAADPSEIAPVIVAPRETSEDAMPAPSTTDRIGPGRPARPDEVERTIPDLPTVAAPGLDPTPAPPVASASARAPAPVETVPTGTPAADSAGSRPRVLARRPAPRRPDLEMPDAVDLRLRPRAAAETAPADRAAGRLEPPSLARATPTGAPRLPEISGAVGGRPLPDVPEVYRSRLDPNRTAHAQAAGASPASERAVERALGWLARHQDADGRWNGGTEKDTHDRIVAGQASFTLHCPPGQICAGECNYPEADTAMTGLALLAYLGAGYTHVDGRYAPTVARGLEFLLLTQKPDGDLRGPSIVVGMYCHAIASLALCEAYALSGDEKLRRPVERAVNFLVKARAADGLAWRYEPNDPYGGDTSILGWVILVLKSAKEVGLVVPATARVGALGWLNKVAEGDHKGLAIYRPGEHLTIPRRATMTAEAWVCRQFLGVGGPGPASDEAAAFLLAHGPDRDPYNLYYWYYGTLAMFQHGGTAWTHWNAAVRDRLIAHQKTSGHQAGSFDPQDSPSQYDQLGGRIYCTAVATLTLEVYYRYLRLYDDPAGPPSLAPRPRLPGDRGIRRAAGAGD